MSISIYDGLHISHSSKPRFGKFQSNNNDPKWYNVELNDGNKQLGSSKEVKYLKTLLSNTKKLHCVNI
jgi:hypothetical protein